MLKRIYKNLRILKYKGNKYECNICGFNLNAYVSGGIKNDIMKKLSIIGGGFRDTYRCPNCGSNDRTRLIYFYISKFINVKNDTNILHVAPEIEVEKYLRKKSNFYISTDLFSKNVSLNSDISDLCFKNDFFDLIICNHVLEHVKDLKKALKEIYRVLNKNGLAILQVPISPVLEKTIEAKNNWSNTDKLKNFGQSDHNRLIGLDYKNLLNQIGFKVEKYKWWKNEQYKLIKYGFINNEIIYIAKK